MANRSKGQFGLYVLVFDGSNKNNNDFLINSPEQIEINDVVTYVQMNPKTMRNELKIGYKVRQSNTYQMLSYDITDWSAQ